VSPMDNLKGCLRREELKRLLRKRGNYVLRTNRLKDDEGTGCFKYGYNAMSEAASVAVRWCLRAAFAAWLAPKFREEFPSVDQNYVSCYSKRACEAVD
jgi:hypothetical protein